MLRTLFEWIMRRVAEAVLAAPGLLDRLVDVAAADERQERHHLLDRHEGIRLVGLAENHFHLGGDVLAGRPGQHGGVLADEFLMRHVVFRRALADRSDGRLRQGVDLRAH